MKKRITIIFVCLGIVTITTPVATAGNPLYCCDMERSHSANNPLYQ